MPFLRLTDLVRGPAPHRMIVRDDARARLQLTFEAFLKPKVGLCGKKEDHDVGIVHIDPINIPPDHPRTMRETGEPYPQFSPQYAEGVDLKSGSARAKLPGSDHDNAPVAAPEIDDALAFLNRREKEHPSRRDAIRRLPQGIERQVPSGPQDREEAKNNSHPDD